jgi:membrane fusion protein, multidrug efflux system
MHAQKSFLIALLSAATLATVGCEPPAARPTPPPPKVSVAHPEVRDIVDYDQYNGWIDATQTVEVRARVRGHIQKIDFTAGQIVAKDQLLYELDPRPFEAEVGRAKDQLHIYEAQLTAARKEFARMKELLSKGGSSQSQVDKTEADALSLEAEAQAAKQDIARVSLNLEYARITAPIAGRISRTQMTEGNLVNAGGSDPLLTTIVAVDPVYVYFSVDERAMQGYMKTRNLSHPTTTHSGDLRESKLAFQFARETDQGFPHTGALDFVDNQVDRQTGTVLVRGVVPNPDGLFVAGSRVKVRVPISAARSTTLVPDTALLSDQDKRYLLVVDDKSVVQRRDISPGRLLDDGMRVVLATDKGPAVSPNEWIIVQGLQQARINYPVEPVKPEAGPAATAATTTTAAN